MQPNDFPMFLWREEGPLAVQWDVTELYKANSLNTLEAPCLALGLQSDGHERQGLRRRCHLCGLTGDRYRDSYSRRTFKWFVIK